MQIDLSSQVILVTGASRGIGRAIALQLAKSGASLALQYGQNQQAAQQLLSELPKGSNAAIFSADLARTDSVKSLFAKVGERFGRINGLVNNAGVALDSPISKSFDDWAADWDYTQAVNLRAAALLSRLLIERLLVEGKGGRIVHIASRAAFRGDTADYLAYAASKAGMVALSHSIARAYGKQQIKSFVIAPGFTRTDMAQDFIDKYGEDYALNDIALPTLTEPKDLAPMVTFLLSGLADHATGTSLDMNAGSYTH